MNEPDFAAAFEKMIESGRPTSTVHDGWYFSFPHSESRMVAIRSTERSNDEYTFERFKGAYRERYGKRFRG